MRVKYKCVKNVKEIKVNGLKMQNEKLNRNFINVLFMFKQ